MYKFIVMYLQVLTDGRGKVEFRLASKLLSRGSPEQHVFLEDAARRIASEGFFDQEQNIWIMPGALLSVKEHVPQVPKEPKK